MMSCRIMVGLLSVAWWQVNASWMDTFVRQYNSFDVNVMVGVGDGLVAPVVRDVGGRGLKAISDDVRNLAHAAQAQELQPQQVGDAAIQR